MLLSVGVDTDGAALAVSTATDRAALAMSTATDRAALAIPQIYTHGESCSVCGCRHG